MSVPEFFIQCGAGTTTMQCCSFVIFAAVSRQAPSAVLLGVSSSAVASRSRQAYGLCAAINAAPAFQRSTPMIVAVIRPSIPNGTAHYGSRRDGPRGVGLRNHPSCSGRR
jgi:hypothetical protein